MLLSHFDYDLPADLIAQEPAAERDTSRLLVMDRAGGGVEHRTFLDIPEYLRAGDVLVLNDTRVLPARLFGVFDTGKSVEALLVRPVGDDCWEAMVKPAKFARVGSRLSLACGHLEATVVRLGLHGRRVLRMPSGLNLRAILDSYGVVPLPPYIKRRAESREPRAESRELVEHDPESRRPPVSSAGSSGPSQPQPDPHRHFRVPPRRGGAVTPSRALDCRPPLLPLGRNNQPGTTGLIGRLLHPLRE